jgi:HPt (histidine-containing phosphotransfer) domain-containing protein
MSAKGPENTVDFGYLESFAAGDQEVISEVLALFQQQAALWQPGLEATNPGWPDLVHTIKGAARGVGANLLGDACAKAEADGPAGLAAVRAALAVALTEMRAYGT